jgi:hypothetical protein
LVPDDAPEAREAARPEPAPQKRAKLVVDEPWQGVAVTPTRDFGTEGLEMLADDGVEYRDARIAR